MGYIYEGEPFMPNFVTFDDGLNYVAIADISSHLVINTTATSKAELG